MARYEILSFNNYAEGKQDKQIVTDYFEAQTDTDALATAESWINNRGGYKKMFRYHLSRFDNIDNARLVAYCSGDTGWHKHLAYFQETVDQPDLFATSGRSR